MGSGAFYLTKWYPGIETDHHPGVHLDYWKDLKELEEKINYYWHPDCDEIRRDIAFTGSEWVHTEHAWLDQAYRLTELIGWGQWR